MKVVFSPGNLIFSAEYVVLNGATALTAPTILGQEIAYDFNPDKDLKIYWRAFDHQKKLWFEFTFEKRKEGWKCNQPSEIGNRLQQLFDVSEIIKPGFWLQGEHSFITNNEFPHHYGLGSSACLTSNWAKLFDLEPFDLHSQLSKGSGYDVMVSFTGQTQYFTREKNGYKIKTVPFAPPFKDSLFFVVLGKKQNSQTEVAQHKTKNAPETCTLADFTSLTEAIAETQHLTDFENLIETHEKALSQLLGKPRVKSQYFSDYPRGLKSLGAWGGDLCLAIGDKKEREYFEQKGLVTLPFQQLVKTI